MRCLIVFSSFLLASAARRHVSAHENDAHKVHTHQDEAAMQPAHPMLQASPLLHDITAFNSCLSQPQVPENCRIFPSLKPAGNKPLKFIIQETAKHQRTNFYEWKLSSDGDQTFQKPIVMGKARSTIRGNRMNFRAKKGAPVLFRFRQFKRLTNKPVFFVYGANNTKDIIYTIRKRYHWGMSVKDPLMSASERNWKHMQKLYIYPGKLTRDSQFSQTTPLYEGLGQKSKQWKFFKWVNGESKKVGSMTRNAKELTIAGFNEQFELKITDPDVDAGVILTGITVANMHQNSRNRGQHTLSGTGPGSLSLKAVMDTIG